MPFKDVKKRREYQAKKKKEYRRQKRQQWTTLETELRRANPDIKRIQQIVFGSKKRKRKK